MKNPGWSQSPDVQITVSARPGGGALVQVGGELDLSSVPQLRSCLSDLVNRGEVEVTLDLSGVTFCDSTALGVFVGAHRRMVVSNGHIDFHNPPAALRNLLAVSGLDQVLTVS